MDKTWLVVANGAEARLYDMGLESLTLLEQFLHPRSRERTEEILSDHANYRETRTTGEASQAVYGGYPEPTDAHDYEIDQFARQIAKRLDAGRTHNEFSALVIVAAPGFHGKLNGHLGDTLKRFVRAHVDKDYTKVPERELLDRIRPHLH